MRQERQERQESREKWESVGRVGSLGGRNRRPGQYKPGSLPDDIVAVLDVTLILHCNFFLCPFT